jgi:hypothetical protein
MTQTKNPRKRGLSGFSRSFSLFLIAHSELLARFHTPALEHSLSSFCPHAREKSVGFSPLSFFWLVCSFWHIFFYLCADAWYDVSPESLPRKEGQEAPTKSEKSIRDCRPLVNGPLRLTTAL